MQLFTSDLYRNFGIGFGVGAVIVAAGNGGALIAAVPQFLSTLL